MKFKIYRKSWRRGGSNVNFTELDGVKQNGDTNLLNNCNMFCCLGMIDIQLGVKPIHVLDQGSPEHLSLECIPQKARAILVKVDDEGYLSSTILTDRAIKINDNSKLTEKEREEKLTKLFAKRGHELEFVNRLAPKAWRVAG